MFTVLTPDNTARVTLNDNTGSAREEIDTLSDPPAITYAIFCFALRHKINPSDVGYTIRYPDGRFTDSCND